MLVATIAFQFLALPFFCTHLEVYQSASPTIPYTMEIDIASHPSVFSECGTSKLGCH